MLFEITNRVVTETLDDTTVPHLARMMAFPSPVKTVTFGRGEDGVLELTFFIETEFSTLTATVAFNKGSANAVAQLLDTMIYPIFLTGEMFLIAWTMGGFDANLRGAHNTPFAIDIPNQALIVAS